MRAKHVDAASYGSLARFKSIQRLQAVGSSTVLGASGDMSDFQYLQGLLDELTVEEFVAGDKNELGPAEIHEYLSRIMYARRSKMNPLWNSILVGGSKDGKRCVLRSYTAEFVPDVPLVSCRTSTCLVRRTPRQRLLRATVPTSPSH